ncbi:MAG TPA: hypothetical protein VK152_12100 [Paludibacter sp.]|nr:hypothetical protein [Paludibacter sp.]
MDIKTIFGSMLTVLGVAGLIYAAIQFAGSPANGHSAKSVAIYFAVGLIFFIAGIGLIKNTNNK